MSHQLTEEHKEKLKKGRKEKIIKYLPINDRYRIKAEETCYTIEKFNPGAKKQWDELGYHSSLESVFASLCEHVTRDNLDNLLFVVQEIREIKKIILQFKTL